MKKLILLITSVSLGLGCSVKKAENSGPSTPISSAETFANQFVVSGDKKVIETYLQSMGISAVISNVVPGKELYQVTYKGDVSYDTIASGLEGQVDYVEPNFRVHADSSADKYKWPNDRNFFKQWALNNIGQSAPYGLPGNDGADMDFLKAKELVKCGSGKPIIVGIIDTGIDYTHPDLKERMWVNEMESPDKGGVAGQDDDKNGLIDDIYGYDFVSGNSTEQKMGMPGDADPKDEDGHGTHCAGSIGAVGDNAEGIVGLACNVQLMALRFIGGGGGSTVDAVRAIYYAIDKKANVLSNSWGGGGDSKALRDAIADAQKAGIVFVVAAGNEGKNIDVEPTYPAAMDKDSRGRPLTNVITVGASDNQDNPADFSNYGHEHVHVFAPGVHILSTFPVSMSRGPQPYAVMSGTSMATPYVAGMVAMLMSANPSLIGKPEEIRKILVASVDQKDSLIGKAISNGRINIAKAIQLKGAAPVTEKWLAKAESISEKGFQKDVADIRREIKVPGAKAIRVHFDFIQIEKPYDNIYLYDKNLRLIANVEDTFTRDHWSAVIPGDQVTVRFTNSLVQQFTMMPQPTIQDNEASCLNNGAQEAIQVGSGKYKCMADGQDSNDGAKKYATFNSQGFSVDRIEYIPATEGEKR